jgi:hypothetical protein
MREKTFQGIINVIPVLIIIVSILLPFSANGWDIGRTIIPANPFVRPGSSLLAGMGDVGTGGQKGPMISVQGSGVTEDGSRFFLEVRLRNPLPMQVGVKEFTASVPAGGTLVNLAMVQPVSIPSGGSGVCRLEGPVARGFSTRGSPLPSASDLTNLRMTISSGGIEMALDEDAIRGMLS